MSTILWLEGDQPQFPPVDTALADPDGLLAAGGVLNTNYLMAAYQQGIFPWFNPGEPIFWWSPSLRTVLQPNDLHVSKSMEKFLRKTSLSISTNTAFSEVIEACSDRDETETWISNEMIQAYRQLHDQGYAHSVEVWQDNELVGGLYGVQVGSIFCGESMFHRKSNCSKAAFIATARTLFDSGFQLIDCQLPNPHLSSLGVSEITRQQFIDSLAMSKLAKTAWPANFST